MSLKRLQINIELLSPAVINSSKGETVLTEAGDTISGSAIRGIFATHYITNNNLTKQAHQDQLFVDMLFKKLKYLAAMPLCGSERSFVAPLSLMKGKSGTEDATRIQDLSKDSKHRAGYKGCKGLAVINDGKICFVNVDKNISMHINRCDDDKRIAGRTIEGGIFNYESVSEGQYFQAEIIGEEADLKLLLEKVGLNRGDSIVNSTGRSHTTQYGQLRLTIGDMLDVENAAPNKETVVLRLETPYIPLGEMAYDCKKSLNDIAKLIGEGVEVEQVWGKIDTVDNFVGVWKMRRPRTNVIAAGTVFKLKKAGSWSDDEVTRLNKLMYDGAGFRTEEGFGQLRVWNADVVETGKDVDCRHVGIAKINKNGETAKIAKKIVKQYILSKMRHYAYDDAKAMRGIKGKAHFFTRLDSLLGDKTKFNNNDKNYSFRNSFSNYISGELRNVTNFETYLRELHMGDRSLLEILRDKMKLPYENVWQAELNNSNTKIGELINEIGMDNYYNVTDGEYFYEYWHWFFRYARKHSTVTNEGGEA